MGVVWYVHDIVKKEGITSVNYHFSCYVINKWPQYPSKYSSTPFDIYLNKNLIKTKVLFILIHLKQWFSNCVPWKNYRCGAKKFETHNWLYIFKFYGFKKVWKSFSVPHTKKSLRNTDLKHQLTPITLT